MSATELKLNGKSPLRRILQLRLPDPRNMSAAVYPYSKAAATIAWANEEIARCRLIDKTHDHCLWIGHAAFDVSAAEAKAIREKFEPLGLRVETQVSVDIDRVICDPFNLSKESE